MSSTTQSIDYREKGVQDVCEIKNSYKRGGVLTKTNTRKILEILEREGGDIRKAWSDIVYLAARHGGLNPKETELGALMDQLLKFASSNDVTKENILEYMRGVVMAVYIFESVDKELANKYLWCKKK